jgi:hypothetical protein
MLVLIKHGLIRKMPQGIKEKLKHISNDKVILIKQGPTMDHNHMTKHPKSFRINIIPSNQKQVELKGITNTKVVKDIKDLGSNGLKMLLKRHTQEKREVKDRNKIRISQAFKDLKVLFKAKKVRKVRNHNLINQKTPIGEGENLVLLGVVGVNGIFLTG